MKIEESSADFKPINSSDGNNSFLFSSISLTKCLWVRFTFLVYQYEGHFAQLQKIVLLQSSFVSLTLLKYLRSEILHVLQLPIIP